MLEACTTLLRHLALHALLVAAAVLAVLALRPGLRLTWGAQAVCAAWCVVPAALAGALLAWVAAVPGVPRVPVPVLQWVGAALPAMDPRPAAAAPWWGALAPLQALCVGLAATWLAGMLALATGLVMRQRAAMRALRRHADLPHWRSAAGSSPAWMGLWRPRLALPLDFEARFDAEEQAAILAHEAEHRRRHDNAWNLLAHALATLQWFNPLAWWALQRFRADQELAVDAAVMATQPPAGAQAYLRALLKSHDLSAVLAPAARGWRGSHPLVERIAMLKKQTACPKRRLSHGWGRSLVAGLGLLALGLGHALEPLATPAPQAPASAPTVMLHLQIEQGGAPKVSPRLFGAMGQAMSIRWRPNAADLQAAKAAPSTAATPWELQVTTTAAADGQLRLQTRLRGGEPLQPLAAPVLVTPEGVPAIFEVRSADGQHQFKVHMTARRAAKPEMPGAAR